MIKHRWKSIALIFSSLMYFDCSHPTSPVTTESPTLTDIDGNTYSTVIIGKQIWTIGNLRTSRLNDGTPIEQATNRTLWNLSREPAYCYYDYSTDTIDQKKWGALYNGYAVLSGKLAPQGWRVPDDNDWNILIEYLMENGFSWTNDSVLISLLGNAVTKALASPTDWAQSSREGSPGNDTIKNNSSGFSGLPAGWYVPGNEFDEQRYLGAWWSITENNTTGVMAVILGTSNQAITKEYGFSYGFSKEYGLSVRLVKDLE